MTDLLAFIQNISEDPGIYQFLNADKTVIYVGKAKNLKKRVYSYFSRALDNKTHALMQHVVHIEIIITAQETEALLLEADLIKKLKPRYNILLRDDKSYPYLCISTQETFPRIFFHRGAKNGECHGPYPSAQAVRDHVALIQKLFQLRNCNDTFFKNRTRPCLQYQIKRCTAPCVNYVSEKEYREQVEHARYFLQGKNDTIIHHLTQKMDQAAEKLEYESAVRYRDQIAQLRQLQQQQTTLEGKTEVDIVGAAEYAGYIACTVLPIRGGRLLGKRTYFPATPTQPSLSAVLSAFITQYYFNTTTTDYWPTGVMATEKIADKMWIESAFKKQSGRTIKIQSCGQPWKNTVIDNALQDLMHYANEKKAVKRKLIGLEKAVGIPHIDRIECFDVSHTQGTETMASCVVFDQNGSLKKDYRIYRITDITPGDDYAALRQAIIRRYATSRALPQLLIIDGGKGQLQTAQAALKTLTLSGITVLGVSKGPERKPGLEKLFLNNPNTILELRIDDPVFHLIQYIRDEAHRFAIQQHRTRRAKKSQQSMLENIPGIGPHKRQCLLKHFGGLQGLMTASIIDIARVPGIGSLLAEKISRTLKISRTQAEL